MHKTPRATLLLASAIALATAPRVNGMAIGSLPAEQPTLVAQKQGAELQPPRPQLVSPKPPLPAPPPAAPPGKSNTTVPTNPAASGGVRDHRAVKPDDPKAIVATKAFLEQKRAYGSIPTYCYGRNPSHERCFCVLNPEHATCGGPPLVRDHRRALKPISEPNAAFRR
jgi:hypothetical protein